MRPMLIGVVAVCAAASLSTHVRADTLIDTVRVDVTATIPERCGFKGAASVLPRADITRAQSIPITFVLDCNTPFAIGVSAGKGAMTHGASDDGSGFAFSKPYQVALTVGTDGADLSPEPCASESLVVGASTRCPFQGVGGDGLGSGRRTAVNEQGTLTVSWGGSDEGPRLAAGDYSDTLTVTVGSRM